MADLAEEHVKQRSSDCATSLSSAVEVLAKALHNMSPEEQADTGEVAHYAPEAGGKAVLLPGDISQEGFCQRLVDDAVAQLGWLDILVKNTGKHGGLLDTTTERFDALMKTNIYSFFWITKAAVPHMKPGASIINTTSVQGYDPTPTIFDYAVTKVASVNLTKGSSKPLMEEHGIRINAVAPGPIWTPLQETDGDKKKLKRLGGNTPFK